MISINYRSFSKRLVRKFWSLENGTHAISRPEVSQVIEIPSSGGPLGAKLYDLGGDCVFGGKFHVSFSICQLNVVFLICILIFDTWCGICLVVFFLEL